MMTGISTLTYVVFLAATALAQWYLLKASNSSKTVLYAMNGWLLFITAVGMTGFYTRNETLPPNMVFLVGPPLLLIIGLLLSRSGKAFLDSLDLSTLTWMHIIRVPIELTLLWLYEADKIPQLMTFEGRNFDIISGLTAPIVAWNVFKGAELTRPRQLLVWNIFCLGLVINVMTHGILSAPTPFQQFAFDHPNIAVFYVPFNWLPGFLVPVVLLAHAASIRRLIRILRTP